MSSVSACCVLCIVSFVLVPFAHADCSSNKSANSAELSQTLVREGELAFSWRLTWTAINGGLTLLSLGGLVVLPRRERADLLLSAGVSAISTAFTWFWPMDVEDDAQLALRSNELAEPERCQQLERLLAHSAADEHDRLTWPWHVGNFITALIPAAVVWIAFHRRGEAVLSLLGGFASGEIELLTQPDALSDVAATRNVGVSVQVAERGLLVRYAGVW
jgi:hypothetical protein